jgi:SPP1 gp7 family putative phage head morphogenesis protein
MVLSAEKTMNNEGPANKVLLYAIIRQQVGLSSFSDAVANQVNKILLATEADIRATIEKRLIDYSGRLTPGALERLEKIEKTIKTIRSKKWSEAFWVVREELLSVSKAEAEFLVKAYTTAAPVIIDFAAPSAELLRTLALSKPLRGRVLRQWFKDVSEADIRRITSQIKIGLLQGEPTPRIVSRVLGTPRLKRRDGVTHISRHQASSIVRTAILSVANSVREEFFRMNEALFSEELYVATLDSRTTPICRALDGKKFPVGVGPKPPLHFSCRSLRVALLGDEAIGNRPAKPFNQKQFLKEYNNLNNIKAKTRADLPLGHKGKFDAYSRQRIRELTQIVDARVTYEEFFSKQSSDFQDSVLGPNRGKLYRKGGLKLDQMVRSTGRQITLAELADMHRSAFTAAGLDPDKF